MICRNILRGLTSWHHQTLSAWTMVVLLVSSVSKYILLPKNIPRAIILSHILLHTPFSLVYHCSHNKVVNDYNIYYVKGDVIMIYISHFILHIGLLWRVPWGVKSICYMIMFCACYNAIENIVKIDDVKLVTKTGLSYSWIFLLHYIPIFMMKGWQFGVYHLTLFSVILCIYKYKVLAMLFRVNDISIDNAFMHCGLIISNLIALEGFY